MEDQLPKRRPGRPRKPRTPSALSTNQAIVAAVGVDVVTSDLQMPAVRNPETAGQIQMAAGLGFTSEQIAIMVGVSVEAVETVYADDSAVGVVLANRDVALAFLQAARSGEDWRASEAWLRHRAGWSGGAGSSGDLLIQINIPPA